MTGEYDPRKSYLSLKAHENMLAFVGFRFQDGQNREGIIKISSFQKPYGGGYLTLTIIVDTGDRQELTTQLNRLFDGLHTEDLSAHLGPEYERIVKVSLDSFSRVQGWYVKEISVHFRSLTDRVNVLIEKQLIPALEKHLPFSFDPVQWWPAGKEAEPPASTQLEGSTSLRKMFRKWFGKS
jgi:hypothetical protein